MRASASHWKFKVQNPKFKIYLNLELVTWNFQRVALAVGEHSIRIEAVFVRSGGAYRRENVGMSSKNSGENPEHRKPKVSWAMIVIPGLVGPKARPKGVVDG